MQHKRFLAVSALLLCLLAMPGSAAAQSAFDFTIGVMGGIGGATDAEPDSGLGNLGLQVLFAAENDSNTRFSVRLGTMDLDTDDFNDAFFVNTSDATLTYLTLSGEYMFTEQLGIRGDYTRIEVDEDALDGGVNMFSIAGVYKFGSVR